MDKRGTAGTLALILVMTLGGTRGAVAAEASSTLARVRSTDAVLADLIEQAADRSPTFRAELAAIQATDGIVYVEPGLCRHGVRACFKTWIYASGAYRFVRIVISTKHYKDEADAAGSIGHELQHALEALSQRKLTNGHQLYDYLSRTATMDDMRFETADAVNAGEAVYVEFRKSLRTGQ